MTKSEFAKQIVQKYPRYGEQYPDEDTIVSAWLKAHPKDVTLVSAEKEAWLPALTRFGSAALSPEGGIPGAVTSGVGELAAQIEEMLQKGKLEWPNVPKIGAAASIGAIPFSGPAKALTRAKAILGQGAKGAGLGAASDVITNVSE